jgi:hypothetical protein
MTAPSALLLGDAGRVFLLTWLEVDVNLGRPVTVESWRDAWGRAADYQTVWNARQVLEGVTA